MLVTVWRHGEAGKAPRDEDRELTSRGTRSVCEALVGFRDWVIEAGLAPVSMIRHSPLVRTTQTAELLAKGLLVNLTVCTCLAPDVDIQAPEGFLPEVFGGDKKADQSPEHLILLTHQPFVSQVIWHWLDDDRLDPILPGGWATLKLLTATRGGGELLRARTSIY